MNSVMNGGVVDEEVVTSCPTREVEINVERGSGQPCQPTCSGTIQDVEGLQATNNEWKHYQEYPLLQSILKYEDRRNAQLKEEGFEQISYPKSNEGWLKTLFMFKGRALSSVALPWTVAIIHAIVYTVLQQQGFFHISADWNGDIFFGVVLSSTLSFLLVFRLNRAASRYWDARAKWGMIVAKSRNFLGSIITYSDHNLHERDEAIRWLIAFNIATMELLRGKKEIPPDSLVGVLTGEEVRVASRNGHPPIYCIDKIRSRIYQLFRIDQNTSISVAHLWVRHLNFLEDQINVMLECCGGLERIRGTPLPVVYVSHLRTFLMLALLFIPYIWGSLIQYWTIPLVAATGFAWLGIEGAASEAEAPFRQDRVNALDMDGYCLGLLGVVKQQLKNHADQQMLDRGQR